ncbi:MAG: hypothetical protein DMF33_06535, partial [Verrucomicrobia bacterium]
MKLRCAKSYAPMCKSSPATSVSAICGITRSSMPLPILSKTPFHGPVFIRAGTLTKSVDNPATTSTSRSQPNKERRSLLSAVALAIGAHYDSVFGSPGANDNGTGVAATLALARRFVGRTPQHTMRFVAFVNEEPPYFLSGEMGSFIYAGRCRARG